jgi:hypothetical protein
LVEEFVIPPVDGKLTIDLYGQIAAILRQLAGKKGTNVPGSVAEQLGLVAGACKFHNLLFSAHGLVPVCHTV